MRRTWNLYFFLFICVISDFTQFSAHWLLEMLSNVCFSSTAFYFVSTNKESSDREWEFSFLWLIFFHSNSLLGGTMMNFYEFRLVKWKNIHSNKEEREIQILFCCRLEINFISSPLFTLFIIRNSMLRSDTKSTRETLKKIQKQ